MGMKILNSYRLSDFYEYVDETLDIYSKTIKVKMLKNINISDYTSSKGLKNCLLYTSELKKKKRI